MVRLYFEVKIVGSNARGKCLFWSLLRNGPIGYTYTDTAAPARSSTNSEPAWVEEPVVVTAFGSGFVLMSPCAGRTCHGDWNIVPFE